MGARLIRTTLFQTTARTGTLRRMGEAEDRVYAHMAANGGVITRAEALALGMTTATVSRRVRGGRLVAVGKGVYVLPGVIRDETSLLTAATSALSAVASHESAARLHGMDGLDPRRVSVTVPVRRTNRFRGVVVHQSTDLSKDDTVAIRGIPSTDIERTIIDLAAVVGEKRLSQLVDQAQRRRLCTYETISIRLEKTARKGKPGVVRLRRTLAVRLGSDHRSESALETELLSLLAAANLQPPHTQFKPPWLRRLNGRVDVAYPDERVVVEGDSLQWHGSPEAFQMDRRRDNLAQLAGWIILRFTWDDITKRPAWVVSTVRTALSRRSGDQ